MERVNSFMEHALQNHSGVTIAYIDFEKAFDTVPHKKLLLRLHSYGVDGCLLLWLENFLTNRTLCTRVGNFTSSEFNYSVVSYKAATLVPYCLSRTLVN